jgi:hypothetical protein
LQPCPARQAARQAGTLSAKGGGAPGYCRRPALDMAALPAKSTNTGQKAKEQLTRAALQPFRPSPSARLCSNKKHIQPA